MNSENKLKIAGKAFGLACLFATFAFQVGSVQLKGESPATAPADARPEAMGGVVVLERHTAPQVLDGTAIRIGHYNPDQKLRLALAVKPPHMPEEEQFIKELITKGSPNFHKFLTADEWNARFAPSVEDEQKVVDWAKSQGLTVTNRYNHRLVVDLEAPSSVIEKAFGVTINSYQVGEEVHFANDRDPVLPATLSNIVYSVQGLNNIQHEHGSRPDSRLLKSADYVEGPVVARGPEQFANGDSTKIPAKVKERIRAESSNITNGYLDPTDIFSSYAYNYNGLQALSHCCNVPGASGGSPPESSIAIAGFGEFLGSDISGFQAQYPYLAYHYYQHNIDGTMSCSGNGCATGETTEDMEWSIATSNSFGSYLYTASVNAYLGGNYNNSTYTDIYSQMLSDNVAKIMTTSWSCTEVYGCSTSTMDSRHSIFNSMVGQGWTLIAASGDRGASDDCSHLAIAYPASDPDVIAAGGTQLYWYSDGTYESENGWQGGTFSGACSENDGGSGGGVSSYYGQPSWQASVASTSYRVTPDFSLNADGDGQNLFIAGALDGDANGTSVVAPELSGFFAQENSYLDYLGSICGAGTTACSPVGLASPLVYYAAVGGKQLPFYDITTGCNSNDVTIAGDLGSYCAHTGYDLVTGWGSANMMQLAWGINWELIPAYGVPAITFTSGPTTSVWYNTNQLIGWSVADTDTSGHGFPPSGVAGFTQAWDSLPASSHTKATPGAGDSFYSGPEFPFSTAGCLDLAGTLCAGGSGQGCHTVEVQAWDNQGTNSTSTYGPVCYDTVAPTVTAADNPAGASSGYVNKSVVVTLTASDSGGSAASGIYKTYYAINTGACSPSTLGSCTVYSGPITISAQGSNYVYYFTEDNAGNFSTEPYIYAEIDTTAPVSSASLSGDLSGSTYYSNVQVTLSASDNLSGVQHTYYTFDGGGQVTYSAPFTVTSIGAHTLKYWSVDYAGNTESTHTLTFTIAAGTPAVMTSPAPSGTLVGPNVTFSWNVPAGATGYALWIGSTGVGSENIYSTGVHTPTSLAVSGLPTNGETLYVRLWTSFNGTLKSNDYTYAAAKQGAMSSPAPSSTLVGPNVTFSWAAGTSATGYAIWIGSTGVGSENVYSTGVHTPTSVAVSGLPTNGETLYVRLWTSFNGTLASTDYTYTTAKQAVMSSPAPSSTLVGPNVTFSWAAGTGAAGYAIWIGSTGVGSENLYSTGVHTTTSAAVAGLPTNGETIYVRLWTSFGGTLASTDYTYTAAKQAVLTTPAPGTTLAGSSVTFDWTAGTGGASGYAIWIGSTGAGSNNLYSTGVHTNLSASVTGLPTNGETIYVRIWTSFNGTLVSTDYTYKAE